MNQTSETPLLPGMKPVLELLRTDPQRIDLVFCKKGLRTRDAQDVQQLCRQSGVRFSLVDQAALDRLCREAAQQNGRPRPKRPCRWWWPWTRSRIRAMWAPCAAPCMPWAARA